MKLARARSSTIAEAASSPPVVATTSSTAAAEAAPAAAEAAPAAEAAGRAHLVSVIEENLLVEWGVLGPLQAAYRLWPLASTRSSLGPLASTCSKLCWLVRKGTEYSLRVCTSEQAQRLLNSEERGRPFLGCTRLCLEAADSDSCLLGAVIIGGYASRWSSLQHLQLTLPAIFQQQQQQRRRRQQQQQQQQQQPEDLSWVLSGVPELRDLRSLQLSTPSFGTTSAGYIGQCQQLTGLTITVSQAAADVPQDLGALAGLRHLRELMLNWPPAVQPAAGAGGPCCLPSSLTKLYICQGEDAHEVEKAGAGPIACWLSHVPGCPWLQDLCIAYGPHQHHSAYPGAVVRLVGRHNPRLRSLSLCSSWSCEERTWTAHVAGLPDAVPPVEPGWYPDEGLAALTGLQELSARDIRPDDMLTVSTPGQWQHLAQLVSLTRLDGCVVECVPQQLAGGYLPQLVELVWCEASLRGQAVAVLLLACPRLRQADITLVWSTAHAAVPLVSTPPADLQQHPSLQVLHMDGIDTWGDAAAAQFAELVDVLGGVVELWLESWPPCTSPHPARGLPDLSACAALTRLQFSLDCDTRSLWLPEQGDVLLMLSPLVCLRNVSFSFVPCISIRAAGWLSRMLPQLEHLKLALCGKAVPVAESVMQLLQQQQQQQQQQQPQQQQALKEQALALVRASLRPGLHLDA